jgi:hypothetical protein
MKAAVEIETFLPEVRRRLTKLREHGERDSIPKAECQSTGSIQFLGCPFRKFCREEVKANARRSEKLIVRTPQSSPLQYLADAGIVVPEEIPADEDRVPLDFTTLSSKYLGSLHSRYAVRHSHIIFQTAKLAADAAGIKRDLRLEKAKFRLQARARRSTSSMR